MRRGEIGIRYDCTSDAVAVSRVGFEQTYAELADRFHPPVRVDDTARQYSQSRERKATTVFGHTYQGAIRWPAVSGDRLPLLEEMVESIAEERVFTILAAHLPGVMRDIRAFVPAGKLPHDRIASCDEYALVLPFESLDGTGTPRSVNAASLTLGTFDTAARGGVVRFEHYGFEGVAYELELRATLAGAVRATINGHVLIESSGGSAVRIARVPADTMRTGTNMLRFESTQAGALWSVRDVRIG